jgi:type VI secretion system secreted protein VgrG
MTSDEGDIESTPFASGAIPEQGARVLGLSGHERLSALFRYDCLLARDGGPLTETQADELLASPCSAGVGPRRDDAIHGIIASLEQIDPTFGPSVSHTPAMYIATVVPTVWLLTRTRATRVYRDTTIPDLIGDVLAGYGLRAGVDFDVRVGGAVTYEVLTQYRESDWDFLQRWMEHEGYFYFFSQHDGAEQLVVADANADTMALAGSHYVPYGPPGKDGVSTDDSVWAWRHRRARAPARVSLAIDDDTARRRIVRADVPDPRGFGTAWDFDVHAGGDDHARALASSRAQHSAAARHAHSASTNIARLRAGHHFELSRHPLSSYDGAYLVTGLSRRWGVDHARFSVETYQGPLSRGADHVARFEALPFDVPFRPERRTPWPRVDGIIGATVAGAAEGGGVAIDERGRVLVMLPFELAGHKGALATRWVPLPTGERPTGLRAGDTVLLAHLHGDPDRPVLVRGEVAIDAAARGARLAPPEGVRVELDEL